MSEDRYPLHSPDRLSHQFRTSTWAAGVMVSILQQYFKQDDRIVLEKATLLWQSDITTTQVQIDVADNIKFVQGQKYPKISVDVGDQDFPEDVKGDFNGYQANGQVNYWNMMKSDFLIECYGLKKLECRTIADEVRYFLQGFRHPIMQTYGLEKLRVQKSSRPIKVPLQDDYWKSALLVEFQAQEVWGTTQESLRLSAARLNLKTS